MNSREKFLALLAPAPGQGDVIFLAAGDGDSRVAHAVGLWREGRAPLITIVSNDTRYEYGSSTASDLKERLLEAGVSHEAIHAEETSSHTKAEADRMMELSRERGWRTVLIVTSPHHQYRAFLTWLASMKRAGLDLTLLNAPAPLPWFAHNPWGRRADLLESEMERIEQYQAKGDVASFEDGVAYLRELELRT